MKNSNLANSICSMLLCFAFGHNTLAQCSNLLRNPSFEEDTSSVYPNSYAQFEGYTSDWEADEKTIYKDVNGDGTKEEIHLHSPDLFSSKYGYYNLREVKHNGSGSAIAGGNSGNCFVGMGDGELIEQQFTGCKLMPDKFYTFEIHVRPLMNTQMGGTYFGYYDWNSGVQLKVWLAKGKLKYKNNDYDDTCKDKFGYFTTVPSVSRYEIMNEKVLLSDFQENTPPQSGGILKWRKYTTTFKAFSSEYDWLIIEIVGNSKDVCNTYLLVDDVRLTYACQIGCSAGCSQTDGQIAPTNNSAVTKEQLFKISNLSNVSKAAFSVFSNVLSQSPLYSKSYFCTNGIKQDITWNGRADNGAPLANGYYFWKLEVENDCGYSCPFSGQVLVSDIPNKNIEPINCYTGSEKIPEACCVENPVISILSGDIGSTESVYRYGYEGVNIAGDPTKNVTVLSIAKTSIKSGKNINIGVGFSTNVGAEFELKIEECKN